MKEVNAKLRRNKNSLNFGYVTTRFHFTSSFIPYSFHSWLAQKDFVTSDTDDICAWLTTVKKGEDDLLGMMHAKNIKGEDIWRIVDVFAPLIAGLKRKDKEKEMGEGKGKKKGKLPPGWKEVTSPMGETFFYNTVTEVVQADAPEMCVSDMPFSELFGKPSALGIFKNMPQDFYETLDDAFKSAAFEDLKVIKAQSQEKANELATAGTLDMVGMSREEAEVLFSYTYEADKNKESPCYIMNKILSERITNQLWSYRGYILHLLKALRKLKPIDTNGGRTILYRGIDGKALNFNEKNYQAGSIKTWPAFTSTSRSEEVVYDQFLERAAQPIIFEIHGEFVGYSIKAFSNFPDEEEILLEPETPFKIVSIQNDTRNPKAKRIVVEVQPMELMIKDAVENFKKAELNMQDPQQNKARVQSQGHAQQQQPQQPFIAPQNTFQPFVPPRQQPQPFIPPQNTFQPFVPQQQQPQYNPPLPPNWVQRTEPQTGRTYYANVVTKTTQWEPPTF